MTIQEAIDNLISAVPGAPFPETVDTIKIGDATQELTGITVTFLANSEVIAQASQMGTNLIITHEPIFYNYLDQTDCLDADPVYHAKRQLLESTGVVIWRFHDCLHRIPPDNTFIGLGAALGWKLNSSPKLSLVCEIQPMTLGELAEYVKRKLGIPTVRVVGDLSAVCERVGIMTGFPPIQYQAAALRDADVLIAGEIHEWEISEYARDAGQLGLKKGLIVIGHAASEEPGMRRIVPWIHEPLPGVPVHFVQTRNPFTYI